jgi:hypothetical protein
MLRCDGIRIHPGHAAGQGNQLGLWSAFAPAPTSEPELERIGFFGCAHRTASTPLGRLTNGPAETSEAISQSMTSVPGRRARPASLSTGRVMRGSVGLQLHPGTRPVRGQLCQRDPWRAEVGKQFANGRETGEGSSQPSRGLLAGRAKSGRRFQESINIPNDSKCLRRHKKSPESGSVGSGHERSEMKPAASRSAGAC